MNSGCFKIEVSLLGEGKEKRGKKSGPGGSEVKRRHFFPRKAVFPQSVNWISEGLHVW